MPKQLTLKPEKCVNCQTCVMVCSFQHFQKFAPTLSAVTVYDYEQEVVTVPVMCLQCDDAFCVNICPTGAMHHNAAGVAEVNYKRCIGCKLCMQACPFGNIGYSHSEGKIFKCDLCGGDPMCVKHCAAGALLFEDPAEDSERRRAVADKLKDTLAEEVAA
ncbi:MAG: 4Fe-4S dicluster domain-containing protein [Coriobacteriales bacterium]|nr:4Fe-4S dicluster domain-containing protein [Coriobacteriales bacterium]